MKKPAHVLVAILCSVLFCFFMTFTAYAAQPVYSGITTEDLEYANPYVHISDFEIIEGVIESQEDFTLRLYVTNANPLADAHNVMMTLFFLTDTLLNTPIGETNQHYIEFLAAGETEVIDLHLKMQEVPSDATEDTVLPSVPMEFFFEYIGMHGTGYENRTSITLMQNHKSELGIQAVNIPNTAGAGQDTPVEMSILNIGQTDLENIIVTIDGNFAQSPIIFEQASLNIDESFLLNEDFMFTDLGEEIINVNISYENTQGYAYSMQEESYTIQVEESLQPIAQDTMQVSTQTNIFESNSFWFYIVIACGAVVVLIIIALCMNLKHNRKKGKKD